MSITSGKIWGLTQLIASNPSFEFHRVIVRKGGYCSLHRHKHKYNGFYVERGKLRITVQKNDYGLTDVTDLQPLEWTVVAPGDFHMFEALEDTVAFEIYWAAVLDPSDIERRSVGGLGGAMSVADTLEPRTATPSRGPDEAP